MDERVSRVLSEVWRGTQGWVFLSYKAGTGRWVDDPIAWPNSLIEPIMGQVPLGKDNYFCPLVFAEPHRQKQYALPTHVLWADLDEADPRDCRLIPSVAWRTTQGGIAVTSYGGFASGGVTKPHWQALWLLGETRMENYVEDVIIGPLRRTPRRMLLTGGPQYTYARQIISAADAAKLSKRIAYAEPGADRGGWDVTQVLRLPGTLNHKHTPPQVVKLLWAKRLYYTVEQVQAAYPPVLEPKKNGAIGWHEFSDLEIAVTFAALPMGVQMALERDNAGADRSLELVRLARELLRFGVPQSLVAHLLMRSALNKFAGRADEHERLLDAVAAAQEAT